MTDLEKYSFNKHSKKYKLFFNREKSKLKPLFPIAKIEHVGSSAVDGLGGKGIIDIVIAVPRIKIPSLIDKLKLNGYDFRPNGGSKERFFFQRIIKYRTRRRVHLHLIYNNSCEWNSMIAVRDYLRKNKKVAEEYSNLKKKAVIFSKGDGKKYRQFKKQFLINIEKKILKE